MSLEEKVGQLFVAPVCPLRGEDHWDDWMRLFSDCHIGNALVKQSDPASQLRWLRMLQERAPHPLLVAADFEWGLAMTMTEVMSFPRNAILGLPQNRSLVFDVAKEIGRQARGVGVHLNLAPVADVNNNRANPVINTRSFGEDPAVVGDCVVSFVKGFQSTGLLACAKHFPGHGDTVVDSHRELPVIALSRERMDCVELPPFKRAIDAGVAVIMTGHLLVPSIDPELPATLSRSCLQGLLREELGFEGLIISDALNMRGLANTYSVEEVALLARRAGCDLLLYGTHISPLVDHLLRNQIPRAYAALVSAYRTGYLDAEDLDASVLRVLKAKDRLGLHLSCEIAEIDLFSPQAAALLAELNNP